MKAMTIYTVTHDHRHGVDTFLFQSSRDDLEVEYYGGLVEGVDDLISQEIDQDTQKIIMELGVDFEIDRMDESLEISKHGEAITIEP